MYYLCSENKGADQLSAQLIYGFVFVYAISRFSHYAAQFIVVSLVVKIIRFVRADVEKDNLWPQHKQARKRKYFYFLEVTLHHNNCSLLRPSTCIIKVNSKIYVSHHLTKPSQRKVDQEVPSTQSDQPLLAP